MEETRRTPGSGSSVRSEEVAMLGAEAAGSVVLVSGESLELGWHPEPSHSKYGGPVASSERTL